MDFGLEGSRGGGVLVIGKLLKRALFKHVFKTLTISFNLINLKKSRFMNLIIETFSFSVSTVFWGDRGKGCQQWRKSGLGAFENIAHVNYANANQRENQNGNVHQILQILNDCVES